MYGGHGYRKFYISEIDRIESEHQAKLPESRLTADEVQAGFDRLSTSFGPFLTILNIEETTSYKESEILEWQLNKFYFRIQAMAWRAFTQRKHSDLMVKKSNKKKK